MRLLRIIIFTIILLSFSNCQVTESDAERYIEKFTENKSDFEKLAQKISSDKKLLTKIDHSVEENEIEADIKEQLDGLDIGSFNILSTECDGIVKVEFVVNWTKNATVYFDKDNCEKTMTKKGYHSKAGMIEVWGLGDGWVMWIDYDYI